MSRTVRRKGSHRKGSRRSARYTPAEIFLAVLGGAIVVLVVGMIVTSLIKG
jgi:hypothetical protein